MFSPIPGSQHPIVSDHQLPFHSSTSPPSSFLWSIPLTSHLRSGWLCKIKLSNTSEFEALLSEKAYKAHCEGESE